MWERMVFSAFTRAGCFFFFLCLPSECRIFGVSIQNSLFDSILSTAEHCIITCFCPNRSPPKFRLSTITVSHGHRPLPFWVEKRTCASAGCKVSNVKVSKFIFIMFTSVFSSGHFATFF